MITTHVLDTARGRPATGLKVRLERLTSDAWSPLGDAETDQDGRVREFPVAGLTAGTYRLLFETGPYFRAQRVESFYPHVSIAFEVRQAHEHHHVPLLLSPFAYSTYRGT